MKVLSLTEFRRRLSTLVDPVQVTNGGQVMGEWKPSIWQVATALDLDDPHSAEAENVRLNREIGELERQLAEQHTRIVDRHHLQDVHGEPYIADAGRSIAVHKRDHGLSVDEIERRLAVATR